MNYIKEEGCRGETPVYSWNSGKLNEVRPRGTGKEEKPASKGIGKTKPAQGRGGGGDLSGTKRRRHKTIAEKKPSQTFRVLTFWEQRNGENSRNNLGRLEESQRNSVGFKP